MSFVNGGLEVLTLVYVSHVCWTLDEGNGLVVDLHGERVGYLYYSVACYPQKT
jgi:hypothetical protein